MRLYDAFGVAWILGHDREWVMRWNTASTFGPSIATRTFEQTFTFIDLVSLAVGTRLRQHGVSDRHLRKGVDLLRSWANLDRPLSHRHVVESPATSCRSFLSKMHNGEYDNIGNGRQCCHIRVLR